MQNKLWAIITFFKSCGSIRYREITEIVELYCPGKSLAHRPPFSVKPKDNLASRLGQSYILQVCLKSFGIVGNVHVSILRKSFQQPAVKIEDFKS